MDCTDLNLYHLCKEIEKMGLTPEAVENMLEALPVELERRAEEAWCDRVDVEAFYVRAARSMARGL